jgi:hypothetical protein
MTGTDAQITPIEIGLTAAIVAVDGDEPMILTAGAAGQSGALTGLPFGPFDPVAHHTFEIGLRAWVEAQTGLSVGYVEQLYTFGDRGRHTQVHDKGRHVVSIGYLALSRLPENIGVLRASGARFEPWYRFFPWEDWRDSRPEILDSVILPLLQDWAKQPEPAGPRLALGRRERLRLCFGVGGSPWDEEKALDRYELLYESGLVEEARRDGRKAALARKSLPSLGSVPAPVYLGHQRQPEGGAADAPDDARQCAPQCARARHHRR